MATYDNKETMSLQEHGNCIYAETRESLSLSMEGDLNTDPLWVEEFWQSLAAGRGRVSFP